MRYFLIVFSAMTLFGFSSFAEAHCRDTDEVLDRTADLALQVANLKNYVEHIASATPAATALTLLRLKVEAFYGDVYGAHHSCGYLKGRFEVIEDVGDDMVAKVEGQGLTADDHINGSLVGTRLGLYSVGVLVDRLD